jgi:hypothetical protein
MCDGPNNHYHIQLIPRYSHEKRGSGNFVKMRKAYEFDKNKFDAVRKLIKDYALIHKSNNRLIGKNANRTLPIE